MITAILSLMGSGGMGFVVGLIKAYVEAKREDRSEELERKHESDLAYKEQFLTYQKQKQEGASLQDITEDRSWTITLFSLKFGYEAKKKLHTLAVSPISLMHAWALLLLVGTLCWCTFIWADNPSQFVWTINPDQEPSKVGIGWGFFEWGFHKQKIQQLTTAGLAFILLHGILGIVGYLLVGLNLNRIRGRS